MTVKPPRQRLVIYDWKGPLPEGVEIVDGNREFLELVEADEDFATIDVIEAEALARHSEALRRRDPGGNAAIPGRSSSKTRRRGRSKT